MWGRGLVHGLGGLGLPNGPGRLPPSRAVDGGVGEESFEPEVSNRNSRMELAWKAGLISGGLALVGDTLAQFHSRLEGRKSLQKFSSRQSIVTYDTFWRHDFVRSLRMASYGFLLYGPLSDVWYKLLDHLMPEKSLMNFSVKVALNQLVFGRTVVAMVFAWYSAWQGRWRALPEMYRTKAHQGLSHPGCWVEVLDSGEIPKLWSGTFGSTSCFHVNLCHMLELLSLTLRVNKKLSC